jgi:hypothetical protein
MKKAASKEEGFVALDRDSSLDWLEATGSVQLGSFWGSWARTHHTLGVHFAQQTVHSKLAKTTNNKPGPETTDCSQQLSGYRTVPTTFRTKRTSRASLASHIAFSSLGLATSQRIYPVFATTILTTVPFFPQ